MASEPGNPFALNQQEALLREIRDELRTSHQTAAGNPSASGRPNPTFIAAQQTADRMVAGEWATLGWANAYQTSIKSSLANDLMGAMGLRAAPQTLWQREYEQMSSSMLVDRLASFPASVMMPGFGRRGREMGAQIYQMSSRFNRTGDNLATNFDQSMNLGRELAIGAARDVRLSGADYGAIMSQSANAGQFDFAGGLGDVKSQFNELRNAVADLTKTMRLGAGEVAQTMGAFRQFGIVDVADQKRMAERLAATSRAAGLSTPEMAAISRAGIESGLALGLGAEGSAALAQNLAMAARTASRSGLVSGHIMAASGGVQGMVQAQQNAINQFAGSSAGFYTALGAGAGSTGGALDDLLSGIGATGGTLGGIVSAETRRMDFMGGLSGGQRQRLYNRNISQQLNLLGIDPNSPEATDYAFTMVRGQMGDAAGLAYARQNFSAEGRRQRWQEAYRTELGTMNLSAQRDYQRRYENESIMGQMRMATGEIGATVGGWGMGLGRVAGYMGRGFGGNMMGDKLSSFSQAAEQLGLNGDDALSAEAAAGAALSANRSTSAGGSREQAIKLMGAATGWGAGKIVGGIVGAGAGAVLAPALVGLALSPLGLAATGLTATAVGIAGAIGGGIGGAALGAGWFGGTGIELTKDEAASYMSAFRGATGNISDRAANIASGKNAGALNALSSSQSFQKLLKEYTNGGALSDGGSRNLAKLAQAAATESGIGSAEDVMGAARAMGVDVQMQDSYNSAASGAKRYEVSMAKVMDGVESSKLSIASAEVATGVAAYARATNAAEQNKARAQLSAAGISGRSMDNLVSQIDDVGGIGTDARLQIARDATDYVARKGDASTAKRYGAFNRVAENIASEAGAMNQAGGMEAYNRIKELEKDPRALMEVVMGGGDSKDAALRDFLVRQDDTGTMGRLKELGTMDDLLSSSNDDRILKTTGLSAGSLKTLRDQISSDPNATPAQKQAAMRQAAATMMVGTSAAVKQASDPVNVAANNMLLAANILREIQGKISNDTSTKSGGK